MRPQTSCVLAVCVGTLACSSTVDVTYEGTGGAASGTGSSGAIDSATTGVGTGSTASGAQPGSIAGGTGFGTASGGAAFGPLTGGTTSTGTMSGGTSASAGTGAVAGGTNATGGATGFGGTAPGGTTGAGGTPMTASGGAPGATGGAATTTTGGTPDATGGTPDATGGTSDATGGTSGATGGTATGTGGDATGGTQGGQSTGCGTAGAATGVQSARTITVAGSTRTYVLSVPDAYSSDTPLPLVFAWHGLGGSGSIARMYFGVEAASGGQAIFVYPDGLAGDDGQTMWDLAADGPDVAFFDALLAALSAEYCIDPSRIFSTGHSYGGFMTNRLGCSRANVLRAVAPVAGGPPFGGASSSCNPTVAAWITHGSNDATVDFSMGEDARDAYLAANACGTTTASVSPSPCVAYDGCSTPVHWCVHESGHDWPSFAAEGIWSFFAQF